MSHDLLCAQACDLLCCNVGAPVNSSRMRVAAATALGAAAVKAKMLADAEEREIQRQVQVAVDAQIQKVQLKLNSMTQLEDALEKERSIMEVCTDALQQQSILVVRARLKCRRWMSRLGQMLRAKPGRATHLMEPAPLPVLHSLIFFATASSLILASFSVISYQARCCSPDLI